MSFKYSIFVIGEEDKKIPDERLEVFELPNPVSIGDNISEVELSEGLGYNLEVEDIIHKVSKSNTELHCKCINTRPRRN